MEPSELLSVAVVIASSVFDRSWWRGGCRRGLEPLRARHWTIVTGMVLIGLVGFVFYTHGQQSL